MKIILPLLALCLLTFPAIAQSNNGPAPTAPKTGSYDIRDFGAVGDDKTINTKAIQDAIDACTTAGGGTVSIPNGKFRTGTVQLKDNVTLSLSPNAQLLGSTNREDYLDRETMSRRGVGSGNGNIVLLFAIKARNVAIEGHGTIDGDGGGGVFFTGHGDAMGPRGPGSPPLTYTPNIDRPHLIVFDRCERVTMRDVFLTRSAYHCVRILSCTNILFDGVRIFNRVNFNNDGFHFDDCQHARIANCDIRCQDDACALFGSNQYFTIANCSFSTRWSVFRFGGGSPNHIAVANCLIYETYGCPIKFGGGNCSDITFDNLIMRDVTGPISITQGGRRRSNSTNETETAANRPRSAIRNISFSNIRATVVRAPQQQSDMPFKADVRAGETNSCITLNSVNGGIIENITFDNVHVTYSGGGTKEMGALRDVSVNTGEYFGISNRPAYGLYARSIKGLTLQNVRFDTVEPDLRPAVVLDGVRDAAINNLAIEGNKAAESALRFINTQDALVTGARLLTPASVFLAVEGTNNANIKVTGSDLSKAEKILTRDKNVKRKAVTVED